MSWRTEGKERSEVDAEGSYIVEEWANPVGRRVDVMEPGP